MEVTFLMDRFGYMRIIDKSAYERNKEAANAENKYVFNCMNTDKICIFTDFAARKGNLQRLPTPTALPAAAKTNPSCPVKLLFFFIYFSPFHYLT